MKLQNPWLRIPADDYENHMSASNVGQLQVLNKIFKDVLDEFNPKSICVLGCTTGNGFEHLINRDVEKIIGIDINQNYLAECSERFSDKLRQLKLICADLNELELQSNIFDLIHAALIFEYVDAQNLLRKISKWLTPDGILSAVFQLPCEKSNPVSDTPYHSLKSLSSIMKLIDVNEIENFFREEKLLCVKSYTVNLPQEKKFLVMYCKKVI
ncbi:MAG: class I SAM-dependent methyltransferase [Melioribacter sp.]|uniref:class I SAM-dependent methyltransferase n=1 Tax=Rosettibacter primus TaxID=3111523 RepID=UPI00247EEE76|nr:class I SAM-dependent methyltransferase [Melioribacter sp.]